MIWTISYGQYWLKVQFGPCIPYIEFFLESTHYHPRNHELTLMNLILVFWASYNHNYTFFSAKYDIPVIIGQLYGYVDAKNKELLAQSSKNKPIKIQELQRGSKYMNLVIGNISFKDALNFSAPCSLDKYMKQWGAKLTKSIFPHGYFSDIQQLEKTVNFPPPAAFYNTIKRANVDMNLYQSEKAEFEKRLALPEDHPDKMFNFKCWLQYYNNLDTSPMIDAISSSFAAFHKYFDVDPGVNLTLPSIAYKSMFNQFDERLPLAYSFSNRFDHVRKLFRENQVGGLTNVYQRDINLQDGNAPWSALYAPNGDRYTYCGFWDFNSMYLYSQLQFMPLSPGIEWIFKNKKAHKKVMTNQISFGQIQWLNAIQETALCLDKDGNKVQIEHAYYRGEVEVYGCKVDGYMIKDGTEHFFEYLGCYFHPDCCIPDEKIENADQKRFIWELKRRTLMNHGTLHVMRECQWRQSRREFAEISPQTQVANILKSDTESSLEAGIISGEIFGFAVLDVETPEHLIKEYEEAGFLFPLVIRRAEINEQHLSTYMKERFAEESAKVNRTTVIQCYHGSQIMAFSPVIQFWISRGMKISNITKFYQFIPGKALKPFADKVYKMRCEATYEKDESKGNTAKIFGNSGKFK